MIAHPAPLSAGLKRAHASFHTPNPKRALVASSVVAPPAALSERIFSVRDPVHGDIELDYVCRVAIDTPEFQRLRGLKQLGACHTVFSGAIHTRFQHCIGTAHLARQLVQSLAANQPQLPIAAKDVICVTLAGLCHDLGHGPFSHTFELFVNDVGGGGSWTHEDASIMMLDQMLTAGTRLAETVAHAGLDATDIVFVKEMIVGKGSKPVGRPDPSQAFLYDIISNERSGLDVDKRASMRRPAAPPCRALHLATAQHAHPSLLLLLLPFAVDYLTRDSACSIGDKVDFSRILKQARVGWVADDSVGGASGRGGRATSTTICFPEKLIEDVLRVFRLRFELHGKLYQHRVTKAQELQIIDILKLADEHLLIAGTSGQRMRLSETVHDVQAYVKVKDSVLDLIECSCEPAMAPAQELLARMRDRRIYKSVGKVALESFGQLTEDDTFSRPEPWCSEEIDEKTGMVLPKTPAAIAEEMVDFYYRGKDADGHGCAADGGGYGSDELGRDVAPLLPGLRL